MLAEQNLIPVSSGAAYLCSCTLEPLQGDEFNVFASCRSSGIAHAALVLVQKDSDNALHESTICSGDNLFECGKSLADIHPTMAGKGKLARAVFDIRLEGSDRPHRLCIRPPDRITFEFPGDIARLLPCLEKCRFMLSRQVAHVLCLLLVLAAGALAPGGDWDEDDEEKRGGGAQRCVRST